jgi:hypothetical protein
LDVLYKNIANYLLVINFLFIYNFQIGLFWHKEFILMCKDEIEFDLLVGSLLFDQLQME